MNEDTTALDTLLQSQDEHFRVSHEIANHQLTKLGEIGADLRKTPASSIEDGTEITIKGVKGDKGDTPSSEKLIELIKPLIPEPLKGDKGDTPTASELRSLIRPLIPPPEKGDKGDTPTNGEIIALIEPLIPEPVKGDKGDGPTNAELMRIIKPLIPPPIAGSPDAPADIIAKIRSLTKVKGGLSYDDLRDTPSGFSTASKSIEAYDESGLVDGNIERLQFTGPGVQATSDGYGTITVVVTGGTTPVIYTETPNGAINGANTAYAVDHDISAIYSFAINGQFIHPDEYSAAGSTITMDTPLDGSLSGLPFTIIYA